jgi:group I intron endonuclease
MSKSKRKQIIGIYCIRRNDKFYVGQSTDILSRFSQHKNSLKLGNHHSRKLQNAYHKYGLDELSFEIIEECLESELTEKEQYWCDTLDAANLGYNIAKFVDSPMRGRKCSEETKKNMSIAQLNRFKANPIKPFSDEKRNKMREIVIKRMEEIPGLREELSALGARLAKNNIGRKHTPEARDNMKEAKKNLPPPSEETKRKISVATSGEKNHFYGKNHSEKTKKIMSELASKRTGEKNPFYGKHHSEESRSAIRESKKGLYDGEKNPFFGKKHSPESIEKISLSKKNKGVKSGKKCNISIARLIRADYAAGVSRKDLSQKYNISKTQISQIVTNKSWKEEWFPQAQQELKD